METIMTPIHIEENVRRLEVYLSSADPEDQMFAKDRIRGGHCFVVAQRGDDQVFGPSRFVGYRDNSRTSHAANERKHGLETNAVISTALKAEPQGDDNLEREYRRFCERLGVKVHDRVKRTYWPADGAVVLRLERDTAERNQRQ